MDLLVRALSPMMTKYSMLQFHLALMVVFMLMLTQSAAAHSIPPA